MKLAPKSNYFYVDKTDVTNIGLLGRLPKTCGKSEIRFAT